MGLNNQEKSQAQQEEEALFAALFPKDVDAQTIEQLARPVQESEVSFRDLSLGAKVTFIRNYVKNYVHQEYTRFRIRRSLLK